MLPRIAFHGLRHACASLPFQRNVHPKFVQELLGHASVAITLDTYSHMLPGMGSEAADAMGEPWAEATAPRGIVVIGGVYGKRWYTAYRPPACCTITAGTAHSDGCRSPGSPSTG